MQNQKKTICKVKNESNYHNSTSNNAIEILKEEVAVKSFTSQKEKLEKTKITQSNKGSKLLKEISEEKNAKKLSKEKPFITTLQDFPELKVCNGSSSRQFNTGNSSMIKCNISWNARQKKNEKFPSFSSVITNTKSKTNSYSGTNKLNQSTENNTAGLYDISKEKCEIYVNAEACKEKELIPVIEVPAQSIRNPNKKKRTDPVLIDLHDVLNVNKNRKRPQKFLKRKFQRHKVTEQLSGNYLDSSNPKRLRGKQREVKKKILTNLKSAIIKGRIIKQKLREKSIADYCENDNVNFINNIDFKTEIKIYLQEQSEKKLKEAEATQNQVKKNCTSGNTNKESLEKNKNVDKVIPSITPEGNFKFSSKFREYCDNIITPSLNSVVCNLIKESVNLQDKSFLKNPIKAKARKRHVSGIREVKKYLYLKKAKLIIIAPNLEKLQIKGSLHDVINDLKSAAQTQNVPYAFALNRYKLGRYTKKNLPVSAFAILSYEGIEELFYKVLELLKEAKAQFSEMVKLDSKKEEYTKTAEINNRVTASFISTFQTELKISDEKNDSD